MSQEKFCLRWNDFETNISSAFRELRNENDLFDVTIACEDENIQAHKVILSACSSFFKTILKRSRSHQNLLLYLRGVTHKDMSSVLDFMYHGEVNVAQDDLNSFLQVAEDLKVKGLTQSQSSGTAPAKAQQAVPPPSVPVSRQTPSRPRADHTEEEVVEIVKSEPSQHSSLAAEVYGGEEEGVMAEYDESYGGQYEEQQYSEQYGVMEQDNSVQGEGKIPCSECNTWVHKRSMARHIERKHSSPLHISCDHCFKNFQSVINLKEHLRKEHGLSTREKF